MLTSEHNVNNDQEQVEEMDPDSAKVLFTNFPTASTLIPDGRSNKSLAVS
jgi:hypothetical protein